MEFDIEQTDHLLSTTRAVRLRLDFERDVPDDLLMSCIKLAEQAPTGAGVSSRRWIIVKDPETKSQLAELYRAAGGSRTIKGAEERRGVRGAHGGVIGTSSRQLGKGAGARSGHDLGCP